MSKSQLIYIIGFMGSGKSTTGKKLASLLGWKYIDLDKKIEEFTGKSIPEIFSLEGEAVFRKTESDLLKGIDAAVATVISTGGGTPCNDENMDYMLRTGFTVYIKMTPEQLMQRLCRSKEERPLIKDLKKEELLEFIKSKLDTRENWYNRCDITVDGMNLNANKLFTLLKPKLIF